MNDTPDRPPQTTAEARAQAAQHRAQAEAARTEAQAVTAAAQAQADALLATARDRAAELGREAAAADRAAAPLEERAGYLTAAEEIREQLPSLEQTLTDLAAEADELAEQIETLDERLAGLGEEREALGMRLAAAREAGSVDDVVDTRTRMAAVDEVCAALTNQQDTAVRRLQAIGDLDDTGEYAEATRRLRTLHAQLRRLENRLNPDRPEAVFDQLIGTLEASLAANLQQLADEQNPARHTIHVSGRPQQR